MTTKPKIPLLTEYKKLYQKLNRDDVVDTYGNINGNDVIYMQFSDMQVEDCMHRDRMIDTTQVKPQSDASIAWAIDKIKRESDVAIAFIKQTNAFLKKHQSGLQKEVVAINQYFNGVPEVPKPKKCKCCRRPINR